MAWYKDGVVTAQYGLRKIIGFGTAWQGQVLPGEGFDCNGVICEISEVINNTELLLVDGYAGVSIVGASYKIIPNASMTKELTRRVNALIATNEKASGYVIQAAEEVKKNAVIANECSEIAIRESDLAEKYSNDAEKCFKSAAISSDASMGYRNETQMLREQVRDDRAVTEGMRGEAIEAKKQAEKARDSAIEAAGSVDVKYALDRKNHKGFQSASTINDLSECVVMLTADGSAAVLPESDPAGRDRIPETGLLICGNKTTGKPEYYDREKNEWIGFGGAGNLFDYDWHNGPRSSIGTVKPGCIPCDGQKISMLQYPEAVKAILAGKQNVVTEAAWLADPTKRNCWSSGDGSSWIRVPDLNAVQAGTGKPFYLRGGPDMTNGTSVGDAIRNITGNFVVPVRGAWSVSGAVKSVGGPGVADLAPGQGWSVEYLTFDASRVVPTAEENRIKTAYGVWCVRVFTEVANAGSVDAATLATQLAVVDAKLQVLDAKIGSTYVYPNGGSASTPANIWRNYRYTVSNPFPGSKVLCRAELFLNGYWGVPGWMFNSTSGLGWGVSAEQYFGGDVISVQTGSGGICTSASIMGGSLGSTGDITGDPYGIPCRVLVVRV